MGCSMWYAGREMHILLKTRREQTPDSAINIDSVQKKSCNGHWILDPRFDPSICSRKKRNRLRQATLLATVHTSTSG